MVNNTNTEWCQSMQHYTWHCWMTHTLILNETNQGDMTPSIVELHIQIQHKTNQSRMISSYTAWPISILNDASQCWTTKWQIYQYFSDFFFHIEKLSLVCSGFCFDMYIIINWRRYVVLNDDNDQLPNHKFLYIYLY